MIKLAYEDPYFRAELEPRDLVYRVARSSKSFEDLAGVEASHQGLAQAMTAGPKGARMLLDLRQAPSRNDPAFEAVVARHRRSTLDHCKKVAVLVKTQAGKLQLSRMQLGDPARVQIFDDEDRAFEWLLG